MGGQKFVHNNYSIKQVKVSQQLLMVQTITIDNS